MKTLYETMSNYYKYNNIDWNYYLNDLAFPKNINDAKKFNRTWYCRKRTLYRCW